MTRSQPRISRAAHQRFAHRLAQYLGFAGAAVTGAAVAEMVQWWFGPLPDAHRWPAVWAMVAAAFFLVFAGLASYEQVRLAGRGYVVTIGTDFGSTRHRNAVQHVAANCADYADVQLESEGISIERQMRLAQDLASSVVDSDFTARAAGVRRHVIINAQMHNAFAIGLALANFKDVEQLRILHDARHSGNAAYFDALRIPTPAVDPDPAVASVRTEFSADGSLLGFALNLTDNTNFSSDVHAHARSEPKFRELSMIERPLTADDERELCYEPILRAVHKELKDAVRETECREVLIYYAGPAALAVGLGSLTGAGTATSFAVYQGGVYVPSRVPRPTF